MKRLPLYSKLTALFLNFFCLVTGIIYFAYPNNSHFWNFAGIVYIFTILFDSSIILYIGKTVNPELKLVKRFRIASYGYYSFVAIAYFLIFFANFIGGNEELLFYSTFSEVYSFQNGFRYLIQLFGSFQSIKKQDLFCIS